MRYLIRTKLILLIGIPVVLTYLAVMAFDILQVRQLVEHETELHMANLVQNDLNEMAAIGNKHGGTLDKFMGDGIMGFSATRNARARCKRPYNAYASRAQIAVRIGINNGEDRRITEPT